MKVNISKLQGGGFATFTPIIRNSGFQNNVASGKGSEQESILDDKIKDALIKEGGLQNDVDALIREIEAIENSSQYAFTNANNRSHVLQLISKTNALRQNQEMWKKARTLAENLGGYGEVAVGASGEVFAYDQSGKLIATTVEHYKKNEKSLRLLSFAELMTARNDDPQLTGKNSVFNAAGNAIGVNNIAKQITDIIKAFGVEELKETRYYTSEFAKNLTGKSASNDELNGLINLSKLLQDSPGNLHKVMISSSSERKHALKAMDYIWKTLGDAAQKKLKVVASLNDVNDPRELILNMIINQTDEKIETSVSPEKMPGETNGSEKQTNKPVTAFEMFFRNDMKGLWTDFMINDEKSATIFRGAVGSKGPLVDKKDNPIPIVTLHDLLGFYQYSSMVDASEIYFGENKISQEESRNIIIDTNADAGVLFMPTNDRGAVDWDAMRRFNEVNRVFEANKHDMSREEAKKLFKSEGFDVNIDSDGNKLVLIESSTVKPFLVATAYTTDAVENAVDDNRRISKIPKEELELLKPDLDRAWTRGQGKSSKVMTPTNPWYHFGTSYYRSTVFIPVKPEASVMAETLSGQGPTRQMGEMVNVKRNIKNSNTHRGFSLNPVTSSTELTK